MYVPELQFDIYKRLRDISRIWRLFAAWYHEKRESPRSMNIRDPSYIFNWVIWVRRLWDFRLYAEWLLMTARPLVFRGSELTMLLPLLHLGELQPSPPWMAHAPRTSIFSGTLEATRRTNKKHRCFSATLTISTSFHNALKSAAWYIHHVS